MGHYTSWTPASGIIKESIVKEVASAAERMDCC